MRFGLFLLDHVIQISIRHKKEAKLQSIHYILEQEFKTDISEPRIPFHLINTLHNYVLFGVNPHWDCTVEQRSSMFFLISVDQLPQAGTLSNDFDSKYLRRT